MVDYDRVPEALQKHWAFHGARMYYKEEYKGNTYYLAEGGPHYDAKGWPVAPEGQLKLKHGELAFQDRWMKDGYFVSAWGMQKGKAVLGYPCYFKIDHDPEIQGEKRKMARLGSARIEARQTIDLMINAGALQRYSGSIIVPAGSII